jgi:hypothetical protein
MPARRGARTHPAALAFAAALALAGCSRAAPDATPDGTLRLWLEKIETTGEEPQGLAEAYALLGPAARSNLEERAARASRVQGRRVAPWEMLAEGRFFSRFRPKSMKASLVGDTATVDVFGDEPNEHATVRCVQEGGGWRIEPRLPELLPIPKRETEDLPPVRRP